MWRAAGLPAKQGRTRPSRETVFSTDSEGVSYACASQAPRFRRLLALLEIDPPRFSKIVSTLGAGATLGCQFVVNALVKGLTVKMIARMDVPIRGVAGCSDATAGGVKEGTVVDVRRHGSVKRINLEFVAVDPGDQVLQPITPAEERQIDDRLHCRP